MAIKFIRKIDELGRVVIPKDLREMFNLKPDNVIEITADDTYILISKADEEK